MVAFLTLGSPNILICGRGSRPKVVSKFLGGVRRGGHELKFLLYVNSWGAQRGVGGHEKRLLIYINSY